MAHHHHGAVIRIAPIVVPLFCLLSRTSAAFTSIIPSSNSFATQHHHARPSSISSGNFRSTHLRTSLQLVPELLESSNSVMNAAFLSSSTSSFLTDNAFMLSKMASLDDYKELTKTIVIVLLFGGGLIPATISANKALIGTLSGKRRGGDSSSTPNPNGKPSLDPYAGRGPVEYIEDSGASGPILPWSSLLFASEKIPLADIVAIIGRIQNVDSVADWRNLPSAKIPSANPDKPAMWLPRSTFKANIRSAPFVGWPKTMTGQPVGGSELEQAEKKRVSSKNARISDAALDAVFDTWAWGASIATPDKVEFQLKQWRADESVFDLNSFIGAAIRGRAITGLGALTFIVIQVVAYGSLFVAPALRVFFDIDIGLGELGSCDPETCTRLFTE